MSITQETRREAYASPSLPEMEGKVYTALLLNGPMIAEEIMDKLGTRNPNNVRPRLSGLKKKGLVKAVGKKPNRNGKNEAIWEVTPNALLPDEGVLPHS